MNKKYIVKSKLIGKEHSIPMHGIDMKINPLIVDESEIHKYRRSLFDISEVDTVGEILSNLSVKTRNALIGRCLCIGRLIRDESDIEIFRLAHGLCDVEVNCHFVITDKPPKDTYIEKVEIIEDDIDFIKNRYIPKASIYSYIINNINDNNRHFLTDGRRYYVYNTVISGQFNMIFGRV